MKYKFHLYTTNLVEKETDKRLKYFEKIEELIKSYRKNKNALFMGAIKYNTDFKIYKAACKEVDINFIDGLL